MNKKQWNALGFMFMIFAIITSVFASSYGIAAMTGDIATNIQDAMYTFLTWLCFIAMFACWICSWFEREDKR